MNIPIHIALVDDEVDIEFIYRGQLRDEISKGIVKFHFFPGAQALLDYISSHTDEVKIIILVSDINMPGMDGITLTTELHKTHPEIDLYLSSAYDQSFNQPRIEKCGLAGYLEKPVDFGRIKKIIKEKSES